VDSLERLEIFKPLGGIDSMLRSRRLVDAATQRNHASSLLCGDALDYPNGANCCNIVTAPLSEP